MEERKLSSHTYKRLSYLSSIKAKAEEWKREGYEVKAKLDGWDRPSKIEGISPDLSGKRGDILLIGKIETEDSVEDNRDQWETFKKYAEQNENVSFRLYLISEEGICRLHKIFE